MKDCGPSCLKIIAKHYGKYYSLQFLRDKCGITSQGVSFLDLSYGAEAIGLRTLAVKSNFDDLKDAIPLPAILHWEQDHFVVLYKINEKKAYISDPRHGLVNYSIPEFLKKWSDFETKKGSALIVERQADFYQREADEKMERKKNFENILGYFFPYKVSFINLFIVMLVVTLLQAFLPFISKAVIDVGINTRDLNFINIVLVANIVIVLSIAISNVIRDWILMHVTSRVNIALISDYLIKLMKLPITFFENKLVGDILQRANDNERIRSFIMNNSLSVLFSSLTFLIFGVILLIFNKIMFLIFVAGSLIYILWVFGFLAIRKKLDWEYFELFSKNQSFWVETVNTIQDIKLNNYERSRRWKWEAIQARLYRVNQKVQTVNSWQSSGAQAIDSLKNLFITFFSASAVISGDITFGVMISTQFILGMLNGPIVQFISFIISAQYAQISFMRLNEIHGMADEEEDSVASSRSLPENKDLLLKNIAFRYSENSPVILKNISLRIPQGKVTAIVGDSGSGKSTLLKVLLRLYKPSFGELLIGGINVGNFSLRHWRDKCGVVMQDGKIFNDSIINNITLEDPNLDYTRLQIAVEVANISSEIEQLPNGYNTVMGEMGRGLSGGQKQRILIARALYKNPDYLFLDEATNALDTINERKIISSLDKVFQGKTVVVVAHRLSTIRKADQIVVLKDGSVVEVGNHESLIAKNGYYFQLIQSQFHNDLETPSPDIRITGRMSDLLK